VFTQTQRTAGASVFREFPRGPVDADNDEQQSKEVVPGFACAARGFDRIDLGENLRRDGIAFARHNLVALQRDHNWCDAAGFRFPRRRSRRFVQDDIGADQWQ
jgi:hypothetical protein